MYIGPWDGVLVGNPMPVRWVDPYNIRPVVNSTATLVNFVLDGHVSARALPFDRELGPL